jgi:ABC-2 type transport system permease protein
MNGRDVELVFGPLRFIRRAAVLWALSIGAIVLVTVAVWPAFEGGSGVGEMIDQLPSGLVKAFGLEDFGTPAGFLRGNLYDFFLPLLLAGAAIGFANSLTSSEEDAGRLETFLAQPVARRALFAGRALATGAGVLLVVLVVAVAQFASDALFGLRIDPGRLAGTLVLCALLALLHGALALAVAGTTGRPSLVLGVGLFVLVGGCVADALFPLASSLVEFARLSPWNWAFAGDPLVNGVEPWRYAALAVPAVLLAGLGTWSFGRRDVAAG